MEKRPLVSTTTASELFGLQRITNYVLSVGNDLCENGQGKLVTKLRTLMKIDTSNDFEAFLLTSVLA